MAGLYSEGNPSRNSQRSGLNQGLREKENLRVCPFLISSIILSTYLFLPMWDFRFIKLIKLLARWYVDYIHSLLMSQNDDPTTINYFDFVEYFHIHYCVYKITISIYVGFKMTLSLLCFFFMDFCGERIICCRWHILIPCCGINQEYFKK